MWASLVQNLRSRVHGLGTVPGGRISTGMPSYGVSLLVHAFVLLLMGLVGYQATESVGRDLTGRVFDGSLDDVKDSTFQDMDQTPEPPSLVPVAGSFSPNLALTTSPTSASASRPPSEPSMDRTGAIALESRDIRQASQLVVPTASMLSHAVSIKGNGAEHVGSVEGAVDRIAVEIVRRLEHGRTLVVWAFDASNSLRAEREKLKKHIEMVYTHITQLDEKNLAADNGLLTMVVAFGNDRKAMTPKPTADLPEILDAIGSVPPDETGKEYTFTTVAEIVGKWGRFKDSANQIYHPMVIVVTDEIGDDQDVLETAIERAQKAKVPVYVLGSQAVFGRKEVIVNYLDPKSNRRFNIPVDQGPESVKPEQIRLPFWYDGPQYDLVEAGFGPYALSRLATATGGIYFVTRFAGQRMGFDPSRMSEYQPDWDRIDRYEAAIQKSPLRQAVVNAGLITHQNLPNMPSLFFPPVDDPNFKDVMANNQALADRTAYTVDEALQPISAVAKLRDLESSRRWQAHYDLIRGRLLAMKVRCYEYNWACAQLKRDPPKFKTPRANAWRLVPDATIRYSDKAGEAAQEAERLLKRVIEDHPDTPWALLAQRELKDPFGFKWVETYVPPRNRGDNAEAAQKKAMKKAEEPPVEPPKL